MKSTGIVRRIDDLGRVVIPREIRKNLRIREGDPLELFTDGKDTVCFRKYSALSEFSDFGIKTAQQLQKDIPIDLDVVFCDTNDILWAKNKRIIDTYTPENIDNLIQARTKTENLLFANTYESLYEEKFVVGFETIISEGDAVGALMFLSNENKKPNEKDLSLLKFASKLIAKSLEG